MSLADFIASYTRDIWNMENDILIRSNRGLTLQIHYCLILYRCNFKFLKVSFVDHTKHVVSIYYIKPTFSFHICVSRAHFIT